MRQTACRPINGVLLGWSWLVPVAMSLFVVASAHAQSTAADAQRILKGMSDYLAAQKLIALTFDSDIEIVTRFEGPVCQFREDLTGTAQQAGSTPALLGTELVFDGKLAIIYGA
jgi:hypothetical protein